MTSQKLVSPLYQVTTRPILMMGAERENIIILVVLAVWLAFAGKDFPSCLIAGVIFIVGQQASKVAAKADPCATKIFRESLQYQGFYAAREKINTPKSIIKRTRKL
jgi:type IV secretory pathway TrbD component